MGWFSTPLTVASHFLVSLTARGELGWLNSRTMELKPATVIEFEARI
jgi:hypothetical protein